MILEDRPGRRNLVGGAARDRARVPAPHRHQGTRVRARHRPPGGAKHLRVQERAELHAAGAAQAAQFSGLCIRDRRVPFLFINTGADSRRRRRARGRRRSPQRARPPIPIRPSSPGPAPGAGARGARRYSTETTTTPSFSIQLSALLMPLKRSPAHHPRPCTW